MLMREFKFSLKNVFILSYFFREYELKAKLCNLSLSLIKSFFPFVLWFDGRNENELFKDETCLHNWNLYS